TVVEDEEQQRRGEIVEEPVVRGEDDADLHRQHAGERDQPQAPRTPNEERETELRDVDEDRRVAMRPKGHLVRPPSDPGRERRAPVVGDHGREIPPGGVAEEELREPRFDVQPEDEPEHQEDAERWWWRRAARAEPRWSDEEREQRRLEEQVVPLEGE